MAGSGWLGDQLARLGSGGRVCINIFVIECTYRNAAPQLHLVQLSSGSLGVRQHRRGGVYVFATEIVSLHRMRFVRKMARVRMPRA